MKNKVFTILILCLCIGLFTMFSLLFNERIIFNQYNNQGVIVGTFSNNFPSSVTYIFTLDGRVQRFFQFSEIEEGVLKRIANSNKYYVKFGEEVYITIYYGNYIELSYNENVKKINKISELPIYKRQ